MKTLLEKLDACVLENENPPNRDSKKQALVNIEKARQDVLAAARECALRVTTCQDLFDEIECFVQLRPDEDITPRKLPIKWRRSQPSRHSKQRRDQVAKRVARPEDSLVASIVGLFAIAEGARDVEEERDTFTSGAGATSRPSAGAKAPEQQQHCGPLPPAAPSAREAALLAARNAPRGGSEGGSDDLRPSLSHDVPESSAATTTMCNMDSCASGHRTARAGVVDDYARADEEEEGEVSSASRSGSPSRPSAAGSGSEDESEGVEAEAMPAVVLSQLPPGVQGPKALMAPSRASQEAASGSATSVGAAAAAAAASGAMSLWAMSASAAAALVGSSAEAVSAKAAAGGGGAAAQAEYGGGLAAAAGAVAGEGPSRSVTVMATALRSQEEMLGNRAYVAQDPRRRPSGQTTAAAILQLRAAERDAAVANAAVAAAAAALGPLPIEATAAPHPAAMPQPRYVVTRPAAAAAAPQLQHHNPHYFQAPIPAQVQGQSAHHLPPHHLPPHHPSQAAAAAAAANHPYASLPRQPHPSQAAAHPHAAPSAPHPAHPAHYTYGYPHHHVYPSAPASAYGAHSLPPSAPSSLRDFPMSYPPGVVAAAAVALTADAGARGGGGGGAGRSGSGAPGARSTVPSVPASRHSQEYWETASIAETEPLSGPGRRGRREGRRRGSGLLGLVRGVVGFVGVSVLSGAAMVLGAAAVNTSLDEQEAMQRSSASRTNQAARRGSRLGRGGDDLIPQRTLQQLRGPDLLALGRG